jgi:hypothetical protein
MRVGDRLELPKLAGVAEHLRGEQSAVDLTVDHDVWPTSHDLCEGSTIGTKHAMTKFVGIDGLESVVLQKPPNLALPRRQATAEYPMPLLRSHGKRR